MIETCGVHLKKSNTSNYLFIFIIFVIKLVGRVK